MSLLRIPLNQITEQHLLDLVTNRVRENGEIDYKLEWKNSASGERRELLSDIGAFVNAGGGDMIFGIKEGENDDRGYPQAVVGLESFAADKEGVALTQACRSWIRPKPLDPLLEVVQLASGRVVVILRIRPGPHRPYMMTFEGQNKIFMRIGAQRSILDVDELRRLFLESSDRESRLNSFVLGRVEAIKYEGGGQPLSGSTRGVLHILPMRPWTDFDMDKIQAAMGTKMGQDLRPYGTIGYTPMVVNFEGCIAITNVQNGQVSGYLQLFRDGCLEGCTVLRTGLQSRALIGSYEFEIRVRLEGYLRSLRDLGVPGPYYVGFSLIDVLGRHLASEKNLNCSVGHQTFPRDTIIIPPVLVEDADASVDSILAPIFNRVANAIGVIRSENYNAAGEWTGRP